MEEVTEGQWLLIAPLLPPRKPRGRRRADDRQTLNGILWVLRSGARWNDLPKEYGSDTRCHRRLQERQALGVWERIMTTLLSTLDAQGKLDWSKAFLDGSFVPAKKGGDAVGHGWKGKGSTIHVMTDGAGIPLATMVTGAQVHEGQVAMDVVDGVWVPRPQGRPKQRPKILAADRGYDSRGFRQELRRRGIRSSIPQRVWPGRRRRPGRPPLVHPASSSRWIVERAHAWMDNWRRLVVRWERHVRNYLALVLIATFMTCLHRISG